MRLTGAALFFLGLIALIVCTMHGCGTFFSWNGRHAVDSVPLAEGHTHHVFKPWGGNRYILAVQVVFDPARVNEVDGMAAVEAKLPLTVVVHGRAGATLMETSGWLDPNEKPNVFYTRSLKQGVRGEPREIAVERLVGPFLSAADEPLQIDIDLGADRVGRYPILERRLVIHDDALPPAIRNAAIGAVVAAIAASAGLVLLLFGWWRRGKRRAKRSGIPRPNVV